MGRVQATGPQHEAKPAASRSLPREGTNGEPSPEWVGEGQGRCEALGEAAPKNPAAYGAWNGGTAVVGTGETRLCPGSETPGRHPGRWTRSGEPYKQRSCEVGERGAGVGAAHSTAEAVAAEPRRRKGAVLGLRVGRR
jgi:hypothetical protein